MGVEVDSVFCNRCRARFPIEDGVANFLHDQNPVVARERDAVAAMDRNAPDAVNNPRELLKRFDRGRLDPCHLREYPCLEHATECRSRLSELLADHTLGKGERVVELGADHCWTSNLLLDGGCQVIAVDINDHLRLAARAEDPNLCRIVADMNHLPLADGTADVVWATAAVHHSWDLEHTFTEAARVLRRGGRVAFCCEPMPSWLRYPFGTRFGHVERARGINETWIPRSTWLKLCARAGLDGHIVFPTLETETIAEKLKRRRLPLSVAPLVKPFLRSLQVSIHLLVTKT